MDRPKISDAVQTQVVLLSRRRCCICFGLHGDFALKKGQIAHLDQNNSNNDLENLAFLCLEHHDEYDGTTSQSKGLREGEVKQYRKELYEQNASRITTDDLAEQPQISDERQAIRPNVASLRPELTKVFYNERSRAIEKATFIEQENRRWPAVLLPFCNEPQLGRKTLPVEYVKARLTYYRVNGVQEFKRLDGGCWLDSPYQLGNLEVGGIVYLIAALLIEGHGASTERLPVTITNFDKDTLVIDEVPRGTYEVKVTLMAGEHGEFFQEHWYRLNVEDELSCVRFDPSKR